MFNLLNPDLLVIGSDYLPVEESYLRSLQNTTDYEHTMVGPIGGRLSAVGGR